MKPTVHLIVEKGRDRGKQFTVPPDGARLGRSSKNDIVLRDPVLSRHHCRLFFKPHEGLWVADLGSANQTLVNGRPVQEVQLRLNDRITVGDSVLFVVGDGTAVVPPVAAGSPIDLGLGERPAFAGRPKAKVPLNRLLLWVLAGAALVVLLVVAAKIILRDSGPPAPTPPDAPVRHTLEISYEKVEASAENVFRYKLEINPGLVISVQIDDLANDRHVRKEKAMDPDYVHYLAEELLDSGFYSLGEDYQGIQPDLLNSWDLSITIDKQTQRVRVVNRVEPDLFRGIREKIEDCGKNELGLWAIQFSPERLREMANNAYLQGRKLYDEREIAYGNLASAIRSYQEAEWYLETVEPKPDYYPDILSNLSVCKQQLNDRYDDGIFRAQRSIKLRDWGEAARELRILCEMVPERADPRNKDARKKLLTVESRLAAEK